MPNGIEYTPEEWEASVGHRPLLTMPADQLRLLHQHWMWANVQRIEFDRGLAKGLSAPDLDGPMIMVERSMCFIFTWYGMLWSIVEACGSRYRNVDLRGPFKTDIDRMGNALRECRHAIMHVPTEADGLDERINKLVTVDGGPSALRRIHEGFGGLFREEMVRRTAENNAAQALAGPIDGA